VENGRKKAKDISDRCINEVSRQRRPLDKK